MQDIHVHIGALVNDTVGTLAAVRYIDGQDTIAAMIMGTGAHLTENTTCEDRAVSISRRKTGFL
jgi:hexokinase